MNELIARRLVVFTVIAYNLAGVFVIYNCLNHIMMKSAGEILMTIGTMPVTLFSLLYLGKYPDFWYPVILIQIVVLGINLYLMDLMVRYFQR